MRDLTKCGYRHPEWTDRLPRPERKEMNKNMKYTQTRVIYKDDDIYILAFKIYFIFMRAPPPDI